MYAMRSASRVLAFFPVLASAAQTCPGGLYALLATPLAQYPPAQSFCSSKFPLSTITVTATAPVSTIYTTPATNTITTTTGTVTVTTTQQTLTVVASVTATTTVTAATTTVSQTVTVNRKRAVTTTKTTSSSVNAAKASAFSALLKFAEAIISPACYCIEGPAPTTTTTKTPLTTSFVTATATFNAIETDTATSSPSTLITTTIASTVLVTATVTATATVTVGNNHACTPGSPGSLYPGQCGPSGSSCACYNENNGAGYCAGYYGSCGQACSSNSDCPLGSACLAASDTGNCGYSLCADQNDINDCPTGINQKRTGPLTGRGSIARALAEIMENDQRRHD